MASQKEQRPSPRRRRGKARRRRQHRLRVLAACLLLAGIAAGLAALLWPDAPESEIETPAEDQTDSAQTPIHKSYYTAEELGLPTVKSPLDADFDGIDDYEDILLGARAYIATRPYYESKYYEENDGYPNDGCGVCTDVIWEALEAAGYDLKSLMDADIAAHPEAYPDIAYSDPHIDFRRVENQLIFFERYAQSLPLTFDDPSLWQPGDIVVFEEHIAICSDRRNAKGVPFIIHHGNPQDGAIEADQMWKYVVVGHFRWNG